MFAAIVLALGVFAPVNVSAQNVDAAFAETDADPFSKGVAPDVQWDQPAVYPSLDEPAGPLPQGALTTPSRDEESVQFPAEGEVLAEVRIEGNTTIQTSAIARHIKTVPGRPYAEQTVREDIASLFGTQWFAHVERRFRRNDKGLVLVFRVLERPIVRSVEYRGSNKLKPKRLAAETGLVPNQSAFDPNLNREAARRLEALYHEKGYFFATVELEKGGQMGEHDVVFVIDEGPKVRVVSRKVLGNEAIGDALLKTKLQTKSALLWLVGGTYDPATIKNDVTAIEQYYRSLGYLDVHVDHEVKFSKSRSYATVEYHVREGELFKVRQIEFVGNKVFSTDELFAGLDLTQGEDFNARILNEDLEEIRSKYNDTGRLLTSVSAQPRYLEEPGVVDLVYHIDEDKVRHIRRINVHIEGDSPYTKKTVVLNNMRIHPGDPANSNEIRKSERRLEGLQIFERGPGNGPRIEIKPVQEERLADEFDFRGQNNDANELFEQPRQQVITRRQNTLPAAPKRPRPAWPDNRTAAKPHTTDYQPMFFREPGAPPFVSTASADAPFRLASPARTSSPVIRGQSPDPFLAPQNPLYESSPQGDPLANPPGQIDLDVFVTEARTGRILFGVGVNSDAGLVGSVVLSEQNFDLFRPPTSLQDLWNGTAFRGGGQRFRMEAVPGSVVSRYLVSWTDPFIFDTNYSLGVSGFFYNRMFEDWDEERGGGRITIGRQLTPDWSVQGAFRLENVVLSDPDVPTPPLLAESVGSNFLSSFRATVTHDTRDAAFLPGEGHIVEASVEQAFGDFNYPRAELEASQFYTLYSRPDGAGRHVLMLRGQLGWTDSDTPIFERFYAGGFQSFRGFEFRGVSPRQGANTRVGGRWLALGTVEYVAPLTASEMVQGVVFSDFGTVEDDIGLDDFRVTAGFGLRVTVPAMGPVPLAFDFAFPIASQAEDDEQFFSFYVGFQR